MTEKAIEVEGLSRTFKGRKGDVVALEDATFSVEQAEIVGLLGANGAGKTTLTKILATLLLPTAGRAKVLGHDVVTHAKDVRQVTGVVFGGDRGLYGRLSGRDNLRFFAVLAGVSRGAVRSRLDASLSQVGLEAAADRPVDTYSKGMRQRLHIAIGMIAEPRLLLLDEPTVGLDPVEADRLRAAVARLRESGVSVLLTSHYLLDIERLASRVVILSGGRVAADLPVAEFARMAGYAATVTIQGTGATPAHSVDSAASVTVATLSQDGDRWTLQLQVRDWGPDSFAELGRALAGSQVLDVTVAPVRLEDVYALVAAQLAGRAPVSGAGGTR